jgi:hypothetical protein
VSEQAQGAAPPAEERVFRTQTEVRAWLDAQGFKVALSTVNLHVKKRLLVPNQDGVFTLKAVEAYTRAAKLRRKDGGDAITDSVIARKARFEAELMEERARKLRLENEIKRGLYVPRVQYETDLADRARALRADLLNFFRTNIDEFVILVGGDMERAPKALEWWEEHLEQWLDRYAQARKISPEAKP